MKLILSFAVLLAAAGLVLPGTAGSSAPAWSSMPAASPVWMAASALVPVPPAQPPSPLLGLPTSFLSQQAINCSAQSSTTGAAMCSVDQSTEKYCSAKCDNGGVCSVQGGSSGGLGKCSAFDAVASRACSVFAVPFAPAAGAFCSAIGTNQASVGCSVEGGGNYKICSVEQAQALFSNNCSATQNVGSVSICSIMVSSARKQACSSIYDNPLAGVDKFCSVVLGGAQCSTQLDATGMPYGKCSAFRGAPANSCSVAPTGTGNCSVINQPGQTTPCGNS